MKGLIMTRRHRIGTIENILNIRCELNVKDYKNPGESLFKVWRFEDNAYEFAGVYSKDDLIEECNSNRFDTKIICDRFLKEVIK